MNAKLKRPTLSPLRQELADALEQMAELRKRDNRYADQISVCHAAIEEFGNIERKLAAIEADAEQDLIRWVESGKSGTPPQMDKRTAADLKESLRIAKAEAEVARRKITALEQARSETSQQVIALAERIKTLKRQVVVETCRETIAPKFTAAAQNAFSLEALLNVAAAGLLGAENEAVHKLQVGDAASQRREAEQKARAAWSLFEQRLNADAAAVLEIE